MQNPIVIFTGPSTAGKTTLCDYLVNKYGFVKPSTYTTRAKRSNEYDHSYVFLTVNEFYNKVRSRQMLEYVESFGHYYGSSISSFDTLVPITLAMTPAGASKVSAYFKNRTFIINIKISLATMIERMQYRSKISVSELHSRLNEWPNHVKSKYDYTINGDNSLSSVCNKLDQYILEISTIGNRNTHSGLSFMEKNGQAN
jgi:guanylate kinase